MKGAPARGYRRQRTLQNTLAPGAAFDAITPIAQVIQVAGASTHRVRAKLASAGGTLSFAFLRPDGATPYGAGNPSDLVLVAGTEDFCDIDVAGEENLRITLTGGGVGTVGFIDVMQAPL